MTEANHGILALNGGSSSIKFAIFNEALEPILKGAIERIGQPGAAFRLKGAQEDLFPPENLIHYEMAIDRLLEYVEKQKIRLIAIGHRVVIGGPKYHQPELLSLELIKELKRFLSFSPQHMPQELELIERFHRQFPSLPQFACFDTGFHHAMPLKAKLLPLPRAYEKKGIIRYGFHGLSYEYLMTCLSEDEAKGKIILAHLGNGSSLAAVKAGKSIDTSMSFTPASGVPMGCRSGDLDPGLVWFLSRSEGMEAITFNEMINFKSGLLGISEISSDMLVLLNEAKIDPRAQEAIDVFCYEIKKRIGAYAAALGGLDTLVFSGGIGENAPTIRARICEGLEFLGIKINSELNEKGQRIISDYGSKVKVHVIPTDEEKMIAKNVFNLIRRKP